MADFNKVGLLVVKSNSFLVCRKNNYTSKLIMPGGQIDPGETIEECLLRETREELGKEVSLNNVQYFGTYIDKAASDDPTINKTVEIKLYQAEMNGTAIPSDEVVELMWFSKEHNPEELSEIIRNKILPDLLKRQIVNW